jgi:pimeloyl-ACP methyl ester carboxylesterase
MRYFNGFSLQNEESFFKDWLVDSAYTVAGFSYGAQRALEYALQCNKRIDRLILLSPAFFQHKKELFIRTQLRHFIRDNNTYISQFLQNVSAPSSVDLTPYLKTDTSETLTSLLKYRWRAEKLQYLKQHGTYIEVILGEEDRIVDTKAAYAFFAPLCTTYVVKGAGHLLQ